MDGWVTRATFAHVAGEETGCRVQAMQAKGLDDESEAFDSPELPPRGGFASQCRTRQRRTSLARYPECAHRWVFARRRRRWSVRSESFFARFSSGRRRRRHRPARWAFVTAILLEAAAANGEGLPRDRRRPRSWRTSREPSPMDRWPRWKPPRGKRVRNARRSCSSSGASAPGG